MSSLKLLIAVPSGIHWFADFATCMISLTGYLAMKPVPGYSGVEFKVMNIKGSILPKSRLQALKAAKQWDATHLLFVDSDHTFPSDMVHQLLAHRRDVVAANCVTKSIPALPTARARGHDLQGDIVYSDVGRTEIQSVWRVGTGVMLLAKRAYMQIPHSAFAMPYKEEADTYQGEDWTLCEALERAGVPIYVDHKVSQQVGHVGIFNYTHEFVGRVLSEAHEEGA